MNESLSIRQIGARTATRRVFLQQCQLGLGGIALASLAGRSARGEEPGAGGPLAARKPPLPAKAKRVIYLHLSGAPPQHELFDYKPTLVKHHLEPCPEDLLQGQRFAFIKGRPLLLGTPYKFAQHGAGGAWFSELIPKLAGQADRLCVIRSMWTDQFNHAPAELFLYTGSPRAGAASLGSWITYGLGTENQDLPAFVVLLSGGTDPTGGKSLWSSGFLPSVYQGVQCRSQGEPVLFMSDPPGVTRSDRRRTLDALGRLNALEHEQFGDPETLTRVEQYELAFRMQLAAPEAMDLSREPAHVLEAYGAKPGESSFANNCLLARRLVEAGVRYVQLYDWGWDCHGTGAGDDIVNHLPKKTTEIDRPAAALIADLAERGMLDETLVVLGGEFGRTSMNEARGGSKFLGRDHHPHCFSIVMAGGGIGGGRVIGETDELGYFITRDKLPIRDLQATILHLLGLDPFRHSFRSQGLDNRLIGPTDEAVIRRDLLA